MTDETPLELALSAMRGAENDDSLRLRFYERVADAELFMLLQAEAEGDQVTPVLWESEYVITFDRAERLAAYVGHPAPYVALSGRAIAGMLAGQRLGMAINLGMPGSEILLPPEAIDWLQQTLTHEPDEVDAHIDRIFPPGGLPETLIAAIDAKLATATAMAAGAYLVGVQYRGGARGHLLAFVSAIPRAQDALVRAASEALTFSGIDAGEMDVGFFEAGDDMTAKLAKVGLRFDLPQGEGLQRTPRMAPGSDPTKPPILK